MADDKPTAPIEADIRPDDLEYNPEAVEKREPGNSKAWLNLLRESEEAFEQWNIHCDNIDKQFASLQRLSKLSRDKEFQMFWANCEVLKPSIYAKAPVPVVVPKFKDRRPVYQAASEVMERCCIVAFDLTRINDLMLLVRDDLSMISRGVAWCRYESGNDNDDYYDSERVCVDFKGRRDFLHSLSRNWREVTWVAGASYLTRAQARDRFFSTSADAYKEAEYKVDKETKEIGGSDNRERAKFWEIWDKTNRRVVWVSEGCDEVLDDQDPHLNLQNFFPCPKPCYGTLQRYSLIPVPDVLQYKDQLDEINLLTARIHALSDAIQVRGFYPSGGGEVAEAIETALKINTAGQVLVPIANWASFGATKEVIIWMPIDMIAQTITGLVALRKQVIDDIYQVIGLADIMRGSTDPNETLGAQELKSEYGSTRIRDKQQEMVRFARDLVEITSEIITEKFNDDTIVEMSQTQLPTNKIVQQQVNQIVQQYQQAQQQAQQLMQSPQAQQMMQQQPDQAQQLMQQHQQQLMQMQQQAQQLGQTTTIDQVLRFLKDNRSKSFVLDIETDSTIMADENGEKERRTEFVQVLSGLLPQLAQMIGAEPQTAGFCGELLKFSTAPFRAGRSLDGAVDELVENMKQKGSQPAGDDPTTAQNKTAVQIEQMKQQTAQQKITSDEGIAKQKLEQEDRHKQLELQNQRDMKQMEINAQAGDQQAEMVRTEQQAQHDQEEHQASMMETQQDMALDRQKMAMAAQAAQHKQADMQQRGQERQQAQQFRQQQARPPGIGP